MIYRGQKSKLHRGWKFFFGFPCLFLFFVQACSLGEEEPPESNETEERSIVPRDYVLLDAQAILLERMILEEGHDEIFSNVGDDSQKVREELLRLEVISIEGEECHVETDISQWNLETNWMARVEPKINDVIHANEVTWCDSSIGGGEFIENYFTYYWGDYSTREEYQESIAEYIDCGYG